ncbi:MULTISPECIES: ABC transporter permease [Roseinatronobacter]|uniref:ABC transporter permease n=1 Tax=Roseinatronobacter domitianus TaxID=2940293 RepID=A0ABT0M1X1_9RHOB|nr:MULTISPECIES: ABC transporter permease [Roseibaca]MCL1628405.1 ABC transporter permease [Roseibaca domitiana]
MFSPTTSRSFWWQLWHTLELIFTQSVRNVRKNHGNAIIGLMLNIVQTMILLGVFLLIFVFAGARGAAIRGDTLIYLMSGVVLFMAHIKTLSAVASAEGPNSAMMKHRPMNPIVAIGGAALAELYIQILSIAVILFLYHTIWTPVVIDKPFGAFAMLLAVWFSGLAIGLVMYAIKPWFPSVAKLLTTLISRMNMVASGKFFLANTLPASVLPYFTWNPLFHAIDQARGFAFINYNPFNTWLYYPLIFSLCLIVIGMLGEFYTRNRASLSWAARQ